VQAAADGFRKENNLHKAADTRDWLTGAGLTRLLVRSSQRVMPIRGQ
jgi:hypothetical protein